MRSGKPSWLKCRIPSGERFFSLRTALAQRGLSTICQSARCPNIGECWDKHHATFLIMGDICTRDCRFCAVPHGNPQPLDPEETGRIGEMIRIMDLDYVVLTSVTRDDLPDGGSEYFRSMITRLQRVFPALRIEALIPDFRGDHAALERVLDARPDVVAHNLETVKSLYPSMNRPLENYQRSMNLLRRAGDVGFLTKSAVMVGMGEEEGEWMELFTDLRKQGVDFLTIGQYLQPTRRHPEVVTYYTPHQFGKLKKQALQAGFSAVASGPLVRSSYRARDMFDQNSGVPN